MAKTISSTVARLADEAIHTASVYGHQLHAFRPVDHAAGTMVTECRNCGRPVTITSLPAIDRIQGPVRQQCLAACGDDG